MKHLLSTSSAADRAAVIQTNFERLDVGRAYAMNPTKVSGVATIIVGPADAGLHYVGELWTDALCAEWRCTVAGAPGAWQQVKPAIVTTATRPVTPLDGYWVLDTDEHFKAYYWNSGGAVWTAV